MPLVPPLAEDGVDHLKKKYDEFWPFFIAFGAITAFGSVS